MKKKIFIAIGCLTVLAAFCAIFFVIRGKSPPISDSDLAFVQSIVSSNENAFSILEEAAEELSWPENSKEVGKIIAWESWDANLTAEILSSNGKTLELLNNAMSRSRLQVPEIQSFDEEFKYLKAWKNLSQLSVLHSIALFREGKEKDAFETTLQLIRFGHEMENSEGVPIHYLVGSAVKSMAFQSLQQLISKSSLSCDSMQFWVNDLDQLGANASALTNVIKMEYRLQSKHADNFAAGIAIGMTNQSGQPLGGISKRLFDPQDTRQIHAQFARTGLKSIRETYNNIPTHPVGYSTNRSILSFLLSGNAIGQMLAQMSLPPKKFMSRKCRENVNAAATQAILALKCYKERHSSLPADFEELVPEFLSAVPMDDFDGKPLRYSAEKKIIYSVGEDLIDSGGETKDAKKKPLDIVFKIEF